MRARKRLKRRRIRRKARPAPKPTWQADNISSDPVQLVISLPKQRMTIYKGGVPVMTTRVSTGKPGYSTPAGVFSILEKRRRHFSNLYDNAPMPHMQRLTWTGIALHGGRVPDYPASHGCIRLPYSFASQLFRYTSKGAHVVVVRNDAAVNKISHQALPQPTSLAAITGARTEKVGEAATGQSMVVAVRTHAGQPVQDLNPAQASVQLASFEDTLARIYAYKARSNKPLRILVTRRTELERRKDIQRLLGELGYYDDKVDGQFGRKSRSAIRLFQLRADLRPTGIPTEAFVEALYRAAGETEVQNGHLYVRQGFVALFDGKIAIRDPEQPIGTHLYTAMNFGKDATRTQWTALTLKSGTKKQLNASARVLRGSVRIASSANDQRFALPIAKINATQALDRIVIPANLRQRLSDLLTPGSSMVISDNGKGRYTGKGTDFIVSP